MENRPDSRKKNMEDRKIESPSRLVIIVNSPDESLFALL